MWCVCVSMCIETLVSPVGSDPSLKVTRVGIQVYVSIRTYLRERLEHGQAELLGRAERGEEEAHPV